MVQQAQAQGVQFNELPDELRVVSNPIVMMKPQLVCFSTQAQPAIVKFAMQMEAVRTAGRRRLKA